MPTEMKDTHWKKSYDGKYGGPCDLTDPETVAKFFKQHYDPIQDRSMFVGLKYDTHDVMTTTLIPLESGGTVGESRYIVGLVKNAFPGQAEEILTGAREYLFAQGRAEEDKGWKDRNPIVMEYYFALSCQLATTAGIEITPEQEAKMKQYKIPPSSTTAARGNPTFRHIGSAGGWDYAGS